MPLDVSLSALEEFMGVRSKNNLRKIVQKKQYLSKKYTITKSLAKISNQKYEKQIHHHFNTS